MNKLGTIAAVALAVLVLAGVGAAAGANFYVTVDNVDGDVPEGDIVLTDADGEVVKETNIDDGTFEFSDIDDGNYSLTAESYGYDSFTHNLEVTDGDVYVNGAVDAQSSVDVTLATGTNVTTTFTAERLDNASAIDGAEVELVAHGEVVQTAETGADGTVDVTDYEMSYDKVRVDADGYQTVTIEDYEFGSESAKTVQMEEGSDDDGFWGIGGSSGDSSDGGIGFVHVFGGVFVLILIAAGLKRRE